jgi:chaperonin GroEL
MSQAKEILFEDEARTKLQKGVHQAAETVRSTLGPKGRNVGIASGFGEPKITADGHSILQEIELKDTFENMGVAIVKEAAAKMKEKCGDGTTTTTLLLDQMIQNGIKYISSGASPINLKRGMEKSVECLVNYLDAAALPIQSHDQIRMVAQVSASGNEMVGELISQAFEKVGREGIITIDESRSTQTTLEIVEGLQFDRGFVSPYFMTQPEKMITEHEKPYFLITDSKISNLQDILNLLQSVAATSRPLVIIAEDIEAEALSTLVINHLRGILKVVAIKAPGFGDRKKAMLEDLAVITGAQVISEEKGLQLKDASLDSLGQAEKIIVTKDSTTIISGLGQQDQIAQRVKQIEKESELASNKYDKEKLIERKAKLKGGVAVIRVGATSESAMKNLKQKFEDSLNSTRAALESGIVIGAGMALAYAAKVIHDLKLQGDERLGGLIIENACLAPASKCRSRW